MDRQEYFDSIREHYPDELAEIIIAKELVCPISQWPPEAIKNFLRFIS